jgi:peptidoglycan-N-acetylmuramic acid deacetylase
MGKLSVDEMVSEIMTMHNYMLEHFGYEMKFFRPPSGYFSDRLLAVAQSLGYTTVQWSYAYPDYEESEPPNPDSFLASVINSAHSGAIYQFHAVTASGVSIIGDAIDAIREKGYEFAQFTDEFE